MILKWFIFLSLYLKVINAYINLPMVTSLIKHFNNTQIISAFFCTQKDALVSLQHFSKTYQINVVPVNISGISYPIPASFFTFLLDGNCERANQILLTANKLQYFASPFKWIIYYNNQSDVNIINKFKDVDILVDSDITISASQNDDIFKVTKIFKRHINSSVLVEDIGNWTLGEGFQDSGYEKVTYKRRRNLMQTVLNTCIVLTNNDTINHLTDKRDIHIDSIAKVNYVLVEHLSDTVNASLKYSIQSTWGYKDSNSSWSGMIGELTRREADIGGTALFLTSDRISIIDYIAMTTPTRSKFIFREPKLSYVSNVFILPFDGFVWGSICALIIVAATVLFIVTKWEWKKKQYISITKETHEVELRDSGLEVAFETIAALCQQGTSSVPYGVPGRITLIFLLISFMFLYTSYSANIVALLQSSSNNIQTLRDILKSRLDVGVHDNVFNRFYFPNASEPVRRALYLQKVAPPGQKPKFYAIEEGIRRMRNGLFAFHVETGPGYKLVTEIFHENEKCGLHEIAFLEVPDPWLAIQKNSSYKKMLKVGLRLLQENGVQGREVGLIYTKKPQCLSRGSSFISVGLVDCYFAAVVLGGGLGAAVTILILEIYINDRLKGCFRN